MTTTTARKTRTGTAGRKVYKTSKPRRDVTQTNLPVVTDDDGNIKLIMKDVLLAALTVPGQMSNAYNRFHRYSFLNMLLVFIQTGEMEPIATFNKWKSLGRTVISGPGSALFVNHPYTVYKRDESGKIIVIDGKKQVAYMRFFPKASVFQLFQTDGPELVLPETPDWNLDMALKVLDIKKVPFKHNDGNTQGYSVDRKVALNPVAAAPLKTLIHEIAHVELGHTSKEALKEYQTHRGTKEFQAEAVALLVCKELEVEGFDEAASRAYIQSWLAGTASDYIDGNKLVEDAVIKEIFSVTDRILVAGRRKFYDELAESESA